jgi:hypothetical protein
LKLCLPVYPAADFRLCGGYRIYSIERRFLLARFILVCP